MDTFILIFGAVALALVVFAGAVAVFAIYQLNAAAEYSRPFQEELEKAAQELAQADAALAEAERARIQAAGGNPGPVSVNGLAGALKSNRETRQEAPGARGRPPLARSPCRFCSRVRDRLVNAWNRL